MRDLRPQPGTGIVPPVWIRPNGQCGRSLDPQVLELSQQLWPWAYRHVEMALHDAPRAAELLEEVAIGVSTRLHSSPEVGRNLRGYLITAFRRRIRLEFLKNGRLAYEGLLRELEGRHPLLAADWAAVVEVQMLIKHLIALMPWTTQRIVNYRLLSFTWEEIGEAMQMPVTQARNKYYYGVKASYERLVANTANRRASEELI